MRDTALILAARNGRPAAVAFLLESGADISANNATGSTAVMEAAYMGLPRTVETLLEHGADVTIKRRLDNNTALHLAVRNASKVACDGSCDGGCYNKVIQLLLSRGADVNATNSKNQTPLDKAVNQRDKKTIDLLRAHGAILYKPNKDMLQQYSEYFDPDPEATATLLSDSLSLAESKDLSPSTTRTMTQTEDVGGDDLALLKAFSLEEQGKETKVE